MKNNFWNINAKQWTRVVDEAAIVSRKVTNPAIVQAIVDLELKSILDVGCGEGWLARALPAEIRYLGIDGSHGLIENAKLRSNHEFQVASYADIQNQWNIDEKFDGVVFNFSLLDQEIAPTLVGIQRFLKPGGQILLQTVHPCFKMPKYEDSWFLEDFKNLPGVFPESMPWFGRTLSSWVNLFGQASLQLEKLIEPRSDGLPTSVIFVLQAKNLKK